MPKSVLLRREQTLYEFTPVNNAFISDLMPGAPDEAVRVYLLLLMYYYDPSQTEPQLRQIAGPLGLTEEQVQGAIAHWVRVGAMATNSDGSYSFLHLGNGLGKTTSPAAARLTEFREFNREISTIFAKKGMTEDDLRGLQDLTRLSGSSPEFVLHACRYGLARGRGARRGLMRYIEKVVMGWLNDGLTLEQAQVYAEQSSEANQIAAALLRHLGEARHPTQDELTLMKKWMEFGFGQEAILAACAGTTAARNPSFAYLDTLLIQLHQQGLTDAARIKQHQQHSADKRAMLSSLARELGTRATPALEQEVTAALAAGLEPAALTLLAREAARRGGFAALPGIWQKTVAKKLLTAADVEGHLARQRGRWQSLAAVADAMGLTRRCTAADQARVQKWLGDWEFSQEVIELAAEQSAHAANPMLYCERVLSVWRSEGITTREQALAKRPANRAGALKFREERHYTDEELMSRFVNLEE